MKKTVDKKIKMSISINPHTLKMLDDKTCNRSNYIDHLLLDFFNDLNIDTSKIKL